MSPMLEYLPSEAARTRRSLQAFVRTSGHLRSTAGCVIAVGIAPPACLPAPACPVLPACLPASARPAPPPPCAGSSWRTSAGSPASWSLRRSWGPPGSGRRSWSGGWARWRACCASMPRCCRARQPPRWARCWTPSTTTTCRRPSRWAGLQAPRLETRQLACSLVRGCSQLPVNGETGYFAPLRQTGPPASRAAPQSKREVFLPCPGIPPYQTLHISISHLPLSVPLPPACSGAACSSLRSSSSGMRPRNGSGSRQPGRRRRQQAPAQAVGPSGSRPSTPGGGDAPLSSPLALLQCTAQASINARLPPCTLLQ